jgi:hypothetical protein
MRSVVIFPWAKLTKSDVKENTRNTVVRSQHRFIGDVTA